MGDMAPGLSDEIRREAARRLDEIERLEGVRVLFAVESGSRAWGFPSPDSDYDVRFVYVRPAAHYLRLDPVRDVVEAPIEGLWDVNGWDLRKALLLLRKGNAVVLEWLRSPLVYREEGGLADEMRALATRHAASDDAVRHYYGLLNSSYGGIEGRETVRLKKYFYSLRAAAALAWVRRHETAPPMALPDLLAGDVLPTDARARLDELLAVKRTTNELGEGPRVPEFDAFVDDVRGWAAASGRLQGSGAAEAFSVEADDLLRRAVGV